MCLSILCVYLSSMGYNTEIFLMFFIKPNPSGRCKNYTSILKLHVEISFLFDRFIINTHIGMGSAQIMSESDLDL